MRTEFLKDEYWYGGAAHFGAKMPVSEDSDILIDLISGEGIKDQFSPLFVSNKGRYIRSDRPFEIRFNNGIIETSAEVELSSGHENLKGALAAAAQKSFVRDAGVPDSIFFKAPQYNTWIELMYNQNQKQILEYAHKLIAEGMKPGVFMIDEGWAPDYGDFDFCARKFSDPKAMVDELHSMGFKVMLWVTPFVSPDSDCFRKLRHTDLLIKDNDGKFALREWWNGFSTVLDLSSPEACSWLNEKLRCLMKKYGVDGFKFDAGGSYLYRADDLTYKRQEPPEHTKSFDEFCAHYHFNELRCVWNSGGEPIVCRLQDKKPSWTDEEGLRSIIPNMLMQGLLGYFYGCPDMIGGGTYGQFADSGFKIDEEMYIRWLETSMLCPMIQFSVSPKRVLSENSMRIVMKLLKLRERFTDYILELAENASKNSQPIMRLMEYEFPDEGFEEEMSQFMLGEKFLAAPITEQGKTERKLRLPKGKWRDLSGNTFDGGEYIVKSKPGEPIIFEKCS